MVSSFERIFVQFLNFDEFSLTWGYFCNFPSNRDISAIFPDMGVFLQFSQAWGYFCNFPSTWGYFCNFPKHGYFCNLSLEQNISAICPLIRVFLQYFTLLRMCYAIEIIAGAQMQL
ncbi:hypothetical protein Taro_044836 [Colocasia esculenta]|uniref:Uncharacterized protein n=1 Tax=Colocasia esculenta TaxID=4460 RepID=A0A843X3C4_COLES|nr:hypothetical protein [Colocasia esculenta]